jgi:hypothetical protein
MEGNKQGKRRTEVKKAKNTEERRKYERAKRG